MVCVLEEPKRAAELFAGWQETIIWSCLQGVMGMVCADDPEHPASALALLGDFGFLAGEPDRELVLYGPGQSGRNFLILVPKDDRWAKLIEECYGAGASRVVRYAFRKEPDGFDRERLLRFAERLPGGYTIQRMDETLFGRCRKIPWCRDWVSQYADYEMYQRYGLGVVILQNGEPVSGASSYSGYRGGIEIEIDTREDHRRRGLALVCGAKLILRCLERGWYPSWDAQNPWSAALAEKLGYRRERAYAAYEIVGGEEETGQDS